VNVGPIAARSGGLPKETPLPRTTALVELVDREQAPLLARRFYGEGPASPITASLAQVPELLEVALPFIGAALGPGSLDAREKELAILRTSALLECRYCVQTHSVVALDCGLDAAEVRALRGEEPLEAVFLAERERVMLAWIDAVALGRGPVDPDVQTRATSILADHELVELTLAVTATLMLNRYCTALDLPTSPDTLARLAEARL
jgi:AhpD family alkylhydroperoxidase